MVSKDNGLAEEWGLIEIAIELDRGRKIVEVSEQFKVPVSLVRKIARKSDSSLPNQKRQIQQRIDESEKKLLLDRVEKGESLDEVSSSGGVKKETLRRWCNNKGIPIPRSIDQLSKKECSEIREMLEEFDWKEVAETFRLSREAVDQLSEAPYRQLDAQNLSYLFELLKEQPKLSIAEIVRTAKEIGIDLPWDAIESYRERLKKIKMI